MERFIISIGNRFVSEASFVAAAAPAPGTKAEIAVVNNSKVKDTDE